jgi:hypothetical protein
MEEMKWSSSSGFLGVLAANKLGFAWLWLKSQICPTYFLARAVRGHGMSKISHT